MCIYESRIRNAKYIPNNKNGGIPPPFVDERTLYVTRKCGNCIECRKQKAIEWQIRITEDIKEYKNAKFVTLTFSNESIKKLADLADNRTGYDRDNFIAKQGVRYMLERWRRKYHKSLRHWLITELGHNGTKNIHLHGIVYTDDLQEIENKWQYGFVWKGYHKMGRLINYVNGQTANYITKYITKVDIEHRTYKPIILCSPGIGKHYITSNGNVQLNKYSFVNETNETYRTESGHKLMLPQYYRNKIYSEEQKEGLWINKMNKDKAWICGEQYKPSDKETFLKLRQWYKQKNIQLGYGTPYTNERQRFQENEIRNKLHEIRIQGSAGVLTQDIEWARKTAPTARKNNLEFQNKIINCTSNLKLINMEINTAQVTQPANEVLGTKDKNLYYLVIKNKKGKKLTVNVGEKTHKAVQELLKDDK